MKNKQTNEAAPESLRPDNCMNNEIKLKTPAVETWTQMETIVRDIAGLRLNEKLVLAGMDAEIQAVREAYQGRLNTVARVLAEKTEAARVWAAANPAEFGGRRSIEFIHGTAGFRMGPPKLKTVARRKWDRVLGALRACRWGAAYIRVKEEINKEQIIADVGAEILSAADLRKAGAQVVREELFYVEPKLARGERREAAEAA